MSTDTCDMLTGYSAGYTVPTLECAQKAYRTDGMYCICRECFEKLDEECKADWPELVEPGSSGRSEP